MTIPPLSSNAVDHAQARTRQVQENAAFKSILARLAALEAGGGGGGGSHPGDDLLLESGDFLLLESGTDTLVLE